MSEITILKTMPIILTKDCNFPILIDSQIVREGSIIILPKDAVLVELPPKEKV